VGRVRYACIRPVSWVPSRRAASPRQRKADGRRLRARARHHVQLTHSHHPRCIPHSSAGQARFANRSSRTPCRIALGVGLSNVLCTSVCCALPADHRRGRDLRVGMRTPSAASVFSAVHRASSTTLKLPHSRRVVRGCHPRRTEVLSAKAQPTVTRVTPPLTGLGHTFCLIRASLLRALSRRSDPTQRHPKASLIRSPKRSEVTRRESDAAI
jgi:hypothetical protein